MIILWGCDVISHSEDMSVVADKGESSSGTTYFSAGGQDGENCDNKTGSPNISTHYFLSNESIRQKWTERFRTKEKDSFVFHAVHR